MTDWQRKLLLNPEWDQAQEGEISTQELARSIAAKLRALKPFGDEFEQVDDEAEQIAEEFDDLADDPNATKDNFNYVMQSLYDWGDQRFDGEWNGKKACWIDTISIGATQPQALARTV